LWQLWDARTGDVIFNREEGKGDIAGKNRGSIRSLSWSPNGLWVASVTPEHTIRVWELTTGKEIASGLVEEEHRPSVRFLSWSPDGRRLAAVFRVDGDVGYYDERIKLWDLATGGKEIANLRAFKLEHKLVNFGAKALAWSPDGQRLALGSALGKIRAYDVSKGQKSERPPRGDPKAP
jgi:WD40 repeat protein